MQADLENLRSQKRTRLEQALVAAYGLGPPEARFIDSARSLDRHLYLLKSGVSFAGAAPASLGEAIETLVPRLLEVRYPRHPHFARRLTPKRVEEMVELFGQLVEAEGHRLDRDARTLDEVSGTLAPLGLVRVLGPTVHLVEDRVLGEIDRKRQQKAVEHPAVLELRRWIDEGGRMGLETVACDLVIRCYARWDSRTLVRDVRPYVLARGADLPEDVVVEKPPLPGQAEWAAGRDMAGHVFGISLRRTALDADGLKEFEAKLKDALDKMAGAALRLPGLLGPRLEEFGLAAEVVECVAERVAGRVDRAVTAESGQALCTALRGRPVLEQVRVLASFQAKTSPKALGRSVATAEEVGQVLGNTLVFGVYAQLRVRAAELPKAKELLDEVARVLRQDEINAPLGPRLKQLAEDGQRLLVVRLPPEPPSPPPQQRQATPGVGQPEPPKGTPVAGERIVFERGVRATGRTAVLAELRKLVAEVEAQVSAVPAEEEVSLSVSLVLRGARKSGG